MNFQKIIGSAAVCLGAVALAAGVSAAEPTVIHTTRIDIPTAITESGFAVWNSSEDESYADDYGYLCLADTENGAGKQELYNLMDRASKQYHSEYTIITPDSNAVAAFDYSQLGLTEDDAVEVWLTYKNDHPLYYWISSSVMYNNTSVYLLADELYAQGSERERCNGLIAASIDEYSELTEGENSAYRIAMAYHDAIIEAIDYAYREDGTPEDTAWAHNILGVFEEKGGVCESYARTFQLLLNHAGVENIFVTGKGNGEDHAWNLVQLDDGEWYWCDLTWDDCPGWMWGVKYNYFCVNDTQNLDWSDGGYTVTKIVDFLDQHKTDLPTGTSTKYLYPLPARASDEYTSVNGELLLRDTFADGQFTFAVAGYNTVQVTEINCTETDLVIPETVKNEGVVFDVISIGGMDENGMFTDEGLNWRGLVPQTIHIPSNMRFIWDYAFSLSGVKAIYTDAGNPYFSSDKGVLYTKNMITLIRYPNAAEAAEYRIPDETYYIAYGAFDSYDDDYSIGCEHLEKITFGANLSGIGIVNWGYGYPGDPDTIGGLVLGGFKRIGSALTGDKEIYLDPANDSYIQENGIIYSYDSKGIMNILHVNKNVVSVQLPEAVQTIPQGAFEFCTQLTEIVIPDTITSIGSHAFGECINLKSIKVYDTENDCIIESKYDVCLPDTLTQLGDYVFLKCNAIESVKLSGKIEEINYLMFYNCKKLKCVWLPESVERIGEAAFLNCSELVDVYFEGDVPTEIGLEAFYNGSKNLTLYYNFGKGYAWTTPEWRGPDGVTYQTEAIRVERDPVTGAIVPHIHDYSVWLTDEIAHIQECACNKIFKEEIHSDDDDNGFCDDCGNVVIDGLVFIIDADGTRSVHDADENLESIAIPDSIQKIDQFAFQYCTKLKEISLPEGLITIEQYAFYNCSALETVYLPNTLTSIGKNAFGYCSSLETIILPASLTTVGENAFSGCDSLKHAYFMGDVPDSCVYMFPALNRQMTLHYRKGTSGWTSPIWVASDGTIYSTAEFTARGDMDGDGILTAVDINMLARCFAGNPGGISLPDSADLDGDGSVTRREVMILSRYCAGWYGYSDLFEETDSR